MTHPTDAVAAIRDYVVAAIATCREAEDARLSDMGKRAENHAIMDMLREQHFAWGEKAKSYEALLAFIDALPLPTCATGDDAAHEGGLMARVENHLRGQVGLPPAPSLPAAPAPTRPRVSTAGSGQEARLVVTPPAPSRPADDGERTALSLLADARKCVALVNVNGYYDVWLARCDRVLANAKRPADDAGDAVREATNALRTAIKARRAAWRSNNSDSYRAACRAVERAMHAVITETDLDIAAAERAQRDAGASGDQRAQGDKGGERPRCECGCVDKLHDAGQPGSRRCNQPGCGCEDFTTPARDGERDEKGGGGA